MLHILILAKIAALAALALPVATETQEAPAMLRDPLRPLAFLVGSCWTGTFPDGKATDTHCFESVFGGQFVRDRHIVRGGKTPYEGETLYAWEPREKRVVYTYWASDGGLSTGTMEAIRDEIVFPETHASGGGTQTMRNVWTRRSADTYDVAVGRTADGQWREMWRMTMRRDGR